MPRLAVGVYATSASTPLFFAQAIGRYVRSRRPGETASIFLPSVPTLLAAGQRDGGAAQPRARQAAPRVTGLDDEALEDAARRSPSADEMDNGFEMLGADAELDQVIFDGSSFGTATPAGSDEEADYLGIPGLLDAAADARPVAAQAGRATRRSAQRPEEVPVVVHRTGSCAICAASSTRWSRWHTTAPASRTAGSTTSCAGSAAGRRWRRRTRTRSRPASRRSGSCGPNASAPTPPDASASCPDATGRTAGTGYREGAAAHPTSRRSA